MRTLIDTSVVIALREGETSILERVEPFGAGVLLSILSVVELEGGVPAASGGEDERRAALDEIYATLEILSFGPPESLAYRAIIAACGFSRRMIVDRMIAATAIANGLALTTLNPRDFRGLPGLVLKVW